MDVHMRPSECYTAATEEDKEGESQVEIEDMESSDTIPKAQLPAP